MSYDVLQLLPQCECDIVIECAVSMRPASKRLRIGSVKPALRVLLHVIHT